MLTVKKGKKAHIPAFCRIDFQRTIPFILSTNKNFANICICLAKRKRLIDQRAGISLPTFLFFL
jgi:hypothetical protein